MKKAAIIFAVFLLAAILTGCRESSDIHVISREAGSGTRDAFTELTGIKEKGSDNTTLTSEITSSAFVVLKSVAGDKNAIGYVSSATLTDGVKAVKVNGLEPSAENIKSGAYPLTRTFNVVTGGELRAETREFLEFVSSTEGKRIIEQEKYAPAEGIELPEKGGQTERRGRIVIAGSTSVAPLMDALADRYMRQHPGVDIEIQQTGSGAGITSVLEGACDIGISSRELTEQERARGAEAFAIAGDGIAVIVNPSNAVTELTIDEIREIFTGERKVWR